MTIAPALRRDVEFSWFLPGRAIDIALRFKGLTWRQVARIWTEGKAAGRLPNIKRPAGGFDLEGLLRMSLASQSRSSVKPIVILATDEPEEVAA